MTRFLARQLCSNRSRPSIGQRYSSVSAFPHSIVRRAFLPFDGTQADRFHTENFSVSGDGTCIRS
jgi:hypothetical protein